MVEDSTIRLRIPRNTFFLGLARHVIGHLAERIGFSEREVERIQMSVDEAIANIILHGDPHSVEIKRHGKIQDYDIDLAVQIAPDRIEIVLIDQGKSFPFDQHGKLDVDAYLAEMRVGGLGIYIIKTLMDEVEYRPGTPEGNVLRMVKKLVPSND